MNAMMSNGKARKSLAEQIDRFDKLLDGLADSLNQAVATAVRDALQVVLTEVRANPVVLSQLQASAAPAVAEAGVNWSSITEQPTVAARPRCAAMKAWLGRQLRKAQHVARAIPSLATDAVMVVAQRVRSIGNRVASLVGRLAGAAQGGLEVLRGLQRSLLTALVVALVAGMAAALAEPLLVAVATGAGSFVLTTLVRVATRLRRAWAPC